MNPAPSRNGNPLERLNGEIVAMDRAIGQSRDGLDRIGERANTLICFNSDNGMTTEMIPKNQQPNMFNGGLRGNKSHMTEGGLRVPCLIEWPGRKLVRQRSTNCSRKTNFSTIAMKKIRLLYDQPLEIDALPQI